MTQISENGNLHVVFGGGGAIVRELAARGERVRAVIGRGSDYYGPGVRNSVAGDRLFPAVLNGGKAMWAGSLDQPHSLTFVDDFARVLVTLGAHEAALGEVWHAPAAEPLTGRQFIELAFAAAGRPPRVGSFSPLMIRLVGLVNPLVRELGELAYEFEAHFVLDGSKHLRAFGGAPTPHREAVRATLGWYADRSTDVVQVRWSGLARLSSRLLPARR